MTSVIKSSYKDYDVLYAAHVYILDAYISHIYVIQFNEISLGTFYLYAFVVFVFCSSLLFVYL